MLIVCVTVYVKPEFKNEFIEETLFNARNTRMEELNLRFDVLQSQEDKNKFFLYEVYKNDEGITQHKETEHYKAWKKNVEKMMAKPREGIKYNNLYPEQEESFISKIE